MQTKWQPELKIWDVSFTIWQCTFSGFKNLELKSILSAETFCELICSSGVLPGKEYRQEKRFSWQKIFLTVPQKKTIQTLTIIYNVFATRPRDIRRLKFVRMIQNEGLLLCFFNQHVPVGKRYAEHFKELKWDFISLTVGYVYHKQNNHHWSVYTSCTYSLFSRLIYAKNSPLSPEPRVALLPSQGPGAQLTGAALHLGQRNVKGSSVRNAHHSEGIIDSHFMPIFPFNR